MFATVCNNQEELKDLKSIESFPWYYPYSGQWNAYCPFEEIEEVDISDLKEILVINDVISN